LHTVEEHFSIQVVKFVQKYPRRQIAQLLFNDLARAIRPSSGDILGASDHCTISRNARTTLPRFAGLTRLRDDIRIYYGKWRHFWCIRKTNALARPHNENTDRPKCLGR